MTKTIASTPAPTGIALAALISAVELIVKPEFDNYFITDCLEMAGVDSTPENINDVIDALMVINRAVAKPLIDSLPEALKKNYI